MHKTRASVGICIDISWGTAGHICIHIWGIPIPMSEVWISAMGKEKWTLDVTHDGSYPQVSCI